MSVLEFVYSWVGSEIPGHVSSGVRIQLGRQVKYLGMSVLGFVYSWVGSEIPGHVSIGVRIQLGRQVK